MDTKQPEALRIADAIDAGRILATDAGLPDKETAAELRRLHAENETLRAGYDAARLKIESLQKAAADRHALQATGAHPAPCARHCEAVAFNTEMRNLRTGYDAARLEIASLQERAQELRPAFARWWQRENIKGGDR